MTIFKKISKIFLLGLTTCSLGISTLSCHTSTSNDSSSIPSDDETTNNPGDSGNNSDNSDNEDNTNGQDNPEDNNQNNNQTEGTISSEIVENKNFDYSQINFASSNQYNLKENYQDFSLFGDFNKFIGQQDKLINDISNFVYQLWIDNSKNVNISKFSFNIQNSERELYLNKSTISFSFSFEISSFKTTSFIVLGQQIILDKNEKIVLSFEANQSLLKQYISKNENDYYLGWMIEQINVTDGKNSWSSNFIPTLNSPSHVFNYNIVNLSSKQSFLSLYEENRENLKSLSISEIKTIIEQKTHNNFQMIFDLIDSCLQIINVFKTNPSVENFNIKTIPNLIDIFVSSKAFPESLKSFFIKQINSSNNLKEILINNKNEIIMILEKEYQNQDFGFLDNFFNLISNFNYSTNQIKSIEQEISNFPNQLKNMFNLFLIDNNLNKTFNDFVISNAKQIIKLSENNNLSFIRSLESLFGALYDEQSFDFKGIVESVLGNKASKEELLNSLIELFSISPQISKILEIFIVENQNLNPENFLAFINEICDFCNNVFGRKDNYQSFWKDHQNIEFLGTWVQNPIFDKTTFKLTFKYEIKMWFKNPVSLNLLTLKNLISDDTFIKLANEFGIDLSTMIPSSYFSVIKKMLLNFVPDVINFGAGKNWNFFTFSANQSLVSFEPIEDMTNILDGYQFTYNLNIWFQDESFIKSFTNYYNSNFNDINLSQFGIRMQLFYGSFWKSIIQNIFLRDYDITLQMHAARTNTKIISNYNSYDSSLYISGFYFEYNQLSINENNIDYIWDPTKKESVYVYTPEFREYLNKIYWKNMSYAEELLGYKPYVENQTYKNMVNLVFDYNDILSSWTNQLQISSYVNPHINFETTLQGWINQNNQKTTFSITFEIKNVDIGIYFPLKFYDIKNRTLTNHININKSVTNIIQNNKIVVPS